jgi:hypothetical protein
MSRLHKGYSLAVILGILALTPLLSAQEKSSAARRDFMRRKLELSKQILEGLTTENFDTVDRSARGLRQLSEAALWGVGSTPNATDYAVFTKEFQRLCEDLTASAKQKNLDGSTLVYLRLTMNCVNCHKYVRFAAR